MKKLFLLALLLIMLGTTQAQTVPAKSSHYNAAEELLQTMDMKRNINESLQQMLALQLKNNPALQPMEASLQSFFTKYLSWDALKEDYIKIYMSEFTESELKQMTKFFQTDVGKKMAAKQTVLMIKGSQIGQEKLQAHMGELQEMMQKGPQTTP